MFLSTCFLAFWIWQDFIFLAFWVQQDSFFLAFWIRQVSGFLNALITCYNHSSLTVASGPFRTVFGVWFPGVVSVFVSGDRGPAACYYCLPKHTGNFEHFCAISATFVFEHYYCHHYCIIHVLRNTAKFSFFRQFTSVCFCHHALLPQLFTLSPFHAAPCFFCPKKFL